MVMRWQTAGTAQRQSGFTLVELLVVVGIFATLAGLTTVSLIRPQTKASLDGEVNMLVADLKGQQLRAMTGDTGSAATAQEHGVYIQSGSYTLFKGASYSAGDADNYAATSDEGVTLATTFPTSQVVFAKGTGDVNGFVNGSNTITLTNPIASTGSKVITINRYGAITVN